MSLWHAKKITAKEERVSHAPCVNGIDMMYQMRYLFGLFCGIISIIIVVICESSQVIAVTTL